MTTTDALAVRERDISDLAPTFVVSLDDLKRQLAQLEQFKREIMVKGTDYGEIPGTDKPTLLKPGAEKLTLAFGLAPIPTTTNKVEDWDKGFFHYEVRCDLISKRTGEVVASAHGSANTREPRYRWRKAERQCPECGKPAVIKGKAEYGGGWLCFKKRDGCGTKFREDDPQITQQVVGNIANPEPFELVNTVLKMAEKRALVAATLIATGGSGTWTQDIEDMPSVTGDTSVIDVEYTPFQERDVDDAPREQRRPRPSADTVTSADERVWKRWLDLSGEASGLGLPVDALRLPIGRAQLTSAGVRLTSQIEARKQQLAAEDAERAAGKAEREDRAAEPVALEGRGEDHSPSSPRRLSREDLWQANKALSDRAGELKLKTRTLPQKATDDEIAAENERLTALLRAHEAGSASPEQVAAF